MYPKEGLYGSFQIYSTTLAAFTTYIPFAWAVKSSSVVGIFYTL